MERAAEKGSAIAAAVEGVERQWGQNLTGMWPIGLVLPSTVLALQTLGLLWTAWDLQKLQTLAIAGISLHLYSGRLTDSILAV
jgi:hypothetical protein